MKSYTAAFSLIVILCTSSASYAQTYATLDTNNIKAGFNAGGDLFWDLTQGVFEVPKGGGVASIFAGNLWVGGLDDTGYLHFAGNLYRSNGLRDFWPGPIANNYNSVYDQTFKRLWKISRDTIQYHIANFFKFGYIMPKSIAEWPAINDPANGIDSIQAPFVDVNGNYFYDPENGDYPDIKGDEAIYFIFNDKRHPHTYSQGEIMGIDVQAMAYAYHDSTNKVLDNTIFISYKINNRSSINYQKFLAGMWLDFDLGYAYDDYIGCDTLLNCFYAYNMDNNDQYYGTPPPAVGCTFLNAKMYAFGYVSINLIDYSTHIDSTSYYLLNAMANDSTHITYGGNGYGGSDNTNFMYPGDVHDSTQWTQLTSGSHFPGDATCVGSIGPLILPAGTNLCLDFAYTWARDIQGNNLTSVDTLKSAIAQIQQFYDAQDYHCKMLTSGFDNNTTTNLLARIRPNPANNVVMIDIASAPGQRTLIKLFDISGKLILTNQLQQNAKTLKLDVSKFSRGFYFIQIENGLTFQIKKLILQ